MPTINQKMSEGMKIEERSDGMYVTYALHVKECVGVEPWQRAMNALTAPGMPAQGATIGNHPITGAAIVVLRRSPEPWGNDEAIVTIDAGPESAIIGIPGGQLFKRFSGGVAVEQIPTSFNRLSLVLPPSGARVPVLVRYTPAGQTAELKQKATLTYFAGRPTSIRGRRLIGTESQVSAAAAKFGGRTNKFTFLGQARSSWLCLQWTYDSLDGTNWDVTRVLALDNVDFWRQTSYFRDPITGLVPDDVTYPTGVGTSPLAGFWSGNGMRVDEVQLEEDFATDPIETGTLV